MPFARKTKNAKYVKHGLCTRDRNESDESVKVKYSKRTWRSLYDDKPGHPSSASSKSMPSSKMPPSTSFTMPFSTESSSVTPSFPSPQTMIPPLPPPPLLIPMPSAPLLTPSPPTPQSPPTSSPSLLPELMVYFPYSSRHFIPSLSHSFI